MFSRRDKLSAAERLKQSVWPDAGWARTSLYYKHRLLRGRLTDHQITAGLAIGMSVSFSPLLGTHFMEAVFLAWIFKAGKLAAFLGTAIGNPLTFPFMFWADYKVGEILFGLMGFGQLIALPDQVTWHYFLQDPAKLFLPMLLGGTVIGIAVWPVAYALLYIPVKNLRRLYDRRYRP